MAWCRTLLWIWLFMATCERYFCSPLSRTRFSNSLRLTLSLRSHVQQLLILYEKEHFGDVYKNSKLKLNELPSATTNYRSWLNLQDSERLYRTFRDLRVFQKHLQHQHQKLQQGRTEDNLCKSIVGIQMDLRDLINQVNSQLESMNSVMQAEPPNQTGSAQSSRSTLDLILTSTSQPMVVSTKEQSGSTGIVVSAQPAGMTQASSVTLPRQGKRCLGTMEPNIPVFRQSKWDLLRRSYITLQNLERYLGKVVRDYTLLQRKYKHN